MELYILTKPFVGSGDFKAAMHEWVRNKTVAAGKAFDPESLPRLYVIHDHVSDEVSELQ